MSKRKYEVRVREQVAPKKWVKKSKFYEAEGPSEARACYQGSGHIMWVSKVSKEKLFGFGEFFTLGDDLLRGFRRGNFVDQALASEGDGGKARRAEAYEKKKLRKAGGVL